MATFLLVHGALHGAWCWSKLVPELQARGHEAVAIDLPGHGQDITPPEKVTLDDYVSGVIAALGRLKEPVTLVGHSLGGMTISAVAERVPERLRRLVYLTAFLPKDGDSLVALAERNPQPAVIHHLRPVCDGAAVVVDPDMVRELFYTDCADADVADAVARLRPEPTAPLATVVRLTEGRFGRVPRVYIMAEEDRAHQLAFQRHLIEASPPTPVRSLPSAHSPFLSMPGRLADMLSDL